MPVGNILKLNFYAIGVEDEQFGRVAAPRYLSAAVIGERAHKTFSIEILDRQAVREKTGPRPVCDRRQSKELGPTPIRNTAVSPCRIGVPNSLW